MSENILYNFAKDLSQLYAKTNLKLVENMFVKIAQSYEEELEKWMIKANQINIKMNLNNPDVFDAIVTLVRIRKAHPAGISKPEFYQMAMNEPSILRFLPLFLVIKNVSNSHDYAVLNPFKNILNAIGQAQDTSGNPPDVGSVTNSINSMETMFREYLEKLIEKTYDDSDSSQHKRKQSRKEKISNLLTYLIRRFADEVVLAYEQNGQIDPVGISENINNPKKILDVMYPNYPKSSISYLAGHAKTIAKQIVKYVDPMDYDLAYNTIKAEIMRMSSIISQEQYYEFKYNANLQIQNLDSEDGEKSDKIKVSSSAWIYPQNLVLLSAILYMIGTKN